MRFKSMCAAAALLLAGASGAMAQDAAPRGKRAGDFVLGFGAVLPTNGGPVGLISGTPNASNAASPLLDGTYFFTPSIALNLIAATTRHQVEVRKSALGTFSLGSVWALPPTLTVQYHPLPQSRISPYIGVGLNTTFFCGYSGSMTPPVTRVRLDTSIGVAPNIGVDYERAPNWLLNLDLKWILMQPDVSVNSGPGAGEHQPLRGECGAALPLLMGTGTVQPGGVPDAGGERPHDLGRGGACCA